MVSILLFDVCKDSFVTRSVLIRDVLLQSVRKYGLYSKGATAFWYSELGINTNVRTVRTSYDSGLVVQTYYFIIKRGARI